MSDLSVVQDMGLGVGVMHNVGVWMTEVGLNPSQWWKPENMNSEFMKKHTESDEFFVALVNNKAASSMVLQETERNQSWKSVDGENPKKALYVHWLCVHRDFAGMGIPLKMVDYAYEEAKKRGFVRLRLDTDASEKKLCKIYQDLGFEYMGDEVDGESKTAFFEKMVF